MYNNRVVNCTSCWKFERVLIGCLIFDSCDPAVLYWRLRNLQEQNSGFLLTVTMVEQEIDYEALPSNAGLGVRTSSSFCSINLSAFTRYICLPAVWYVQIFWTPL